MTKNAFYFMLKLYSFLRYLHFCPEILVTQKDGLISVRLIRLWLISKFMTSKTGQQIITIHILPNILRSKGNQSMKFGKLIKVQRQKYFSSKIMQKMRQGNQFQLSFCFLKKAFYDVKASGQHLSFNVFWQTSTQIYNQNKPYNISNC